MIWYKTVTNGHEMFLSSFDFVFKLCLIPFNPSNILLIHPFKIYIYIYISFDLYKVNIKALISLGYKLRKKLKP